jgi:hypothetical protein
MSSKPLKVWVPITELHTLVEKKSKQTDLNDIGTGVSFKSVCFDFFSTNVCSSVIGTHTFKGFDDITL